MNGKCSGEHRVSREEIPRSRSTPPRFFILVHDFVLSLIPQKTGFFLKDRRVKSIRTIEQH